MYQDQQSHPRQASCRKKLTFGPPNDWRAATDAEFLDRELRRNYYLSDLVEEFGAGEVEAACRHIYQFPASLIDSFEEAGAIRKALTDAH